MPKITVRTAERGKWIIILDTYFNSHEPSLSDAEKRVEEIQKLIQEKIDVNKDLRNRLEGLPDFVQDNIDYDKIPLAEIIKENNKLWVEIHAREEHAD